MDTLFRLACFAVFAVFLWPILKEAVREIRDALELNAKTQENMEMKRVMFQSVGPVFDYAQVVENVKQFNREISSGEGLAGRLSSFRNWCYAPEIDMFAPRRYVGLAGMDAHFYAQAEGGGLARQGERALGKWFVALLPDSELLGHLVTRLASRFPQVRHSDTRLKLYVPKDWTRTRPVS